MFSKGCLLWSLTVCLWSTGAYGGNRDEVQVLYPTVPVIVARGEPLVLKVQVLTTDFIGGMTCRAIRRPTGGRAPQAVVPSQHQTDSEVFAVSMDTSAMPVGDYLFLVEAYRLSKKPIQGQARVQVTIVDHAPVTITAPADHATLKDDIQIVVEADPLFRATAVVLYKDGEELLRPETTHFKETWRVQDDTPGEHSLALSVTDTQGRTYTTAVKVAIAPRITVTGLDPTRIVFIMPQGYEITLGAATENDDLVDKVNYTLDGQPLSAAVMAPWSLVLDARALQDGTHEASAKAVLKDGKSWASGPVRFTLVNFIVDPEVAQVRLRELMAEERRAYRGQEHSSDRVRRYLSGKRERAMWESRMLLGLKAAVVLASTREADKLKGAACLIRDVIYETGLDSAYGQAAVQMAKQFNLPLLPVYRIDRGGYDAKKGPVPYYEGYPFYEYWKWADSQRDLQR